MTASKRTRTTVASVAVAGALIGGTLVVPQLAIASNNTITATTAVNVRIEPTISSEILGTLTAGEQVERRGDPQGEWTPITYNGKSAWVYSEYTSLTGIESAAGGTATATAKLNVRAGMSTLTSILGTLAEGETVNVTGSQVGGWVPVSYNGRDGYAFATYLSFDSTTEAPATTEPDPVEADPAEPETTEPDATEPETSDPETTNPETSDPGSTEGGSTVTGTATATTALNVRSGPGTSYSVISVLSTGESVTTTGDDQNGWTPITYKGQDAWVSTQYLSTSGSVDEQEEPSSGETETAYTTTDVNLRTGPGLDYRIVRVLSPNTEVELTGLTENGFSQVSDDGTLRWISTTYLSDEPVSTSGGSGSTAGPSVPAGAGSGTSLNTGGSSGLDSLTANAKGIVYTIRENYPQITTMYGVRADPLPDHPSGRAVDIMMPNGSSDVALGNEIAAYLQQNANSLNIEYLIWRQRIWINGQSGWTAMADRGGITANHYDHIHVTVNY
ncbi:MAG: SH3 domain-containing protein [Propionibacterium sp.]|nr:SH3 domain-containing protein [Propionibacterium sp.]